MLEWFLVSHFVRRSYFAIKCATVKGLPRRERNASETAPVRNKASDNANAFAMRDRVYYFEYIVQNWFIQIFKINISYTHACMRARTHLRFSGLHYCIELFINGCAEFCFIGFSCPLTCRNLHANACTRTHFFISRLVISMNRFAWYTKPLIWSTHELILPVVGASARTRDRVNMGTLVVHWYSIVEWARTLHIDSHPNMLIEYTEFQRAITELFANVRPICLD